MRWALSGQAAMCCLSLLHISPISPPVPVKSKCWLSCAPSNPHLWCLQVSTRELVLIKGALMQQQAGGARQRGHGLDRHDAIQSPILGGHHALDMYALDPLSRLSPYLSDSSILASQQSVLGPSPPGTSPPLLSLLLAANASECSAASDMHHPRYAYPAFANGTGEQTLSAQDSEVRQSLLELVMGRHTLGAAFKVGRGGGILGGTLLGHPGHTLGAVFKVGKGGE